MEKINKWYLMGAVFLAVVLIVLVIGIVIIEIRKKQASEILPEHINIIHTNPVESASSAVGVSSSDQKMGNIGEIQIKNETTGEEQALITPEIPGVITSTVGRIIAVNGTTVRVSSEGSNFADGISRTVTGIVTEDTVIIKGVQRAKGTVGLAMLKADQQILLEGEGNIRGKVDFNIRSINILN